MQIICMPIQENVCFDICFSRQLKLGWTWSLEAGFSSVQKTLLYCKWGDLWKWIMRCRCEKFPKYDGQYKRPCDISYLTSSKRNLNLMFLPNLTSYLNGKSCFLLILWHKTFRIHTNSILLCRWIRNSILKISDISIFTFSKDMVQFLQDFGEESFFFLTLYYAYFFTYSYRRFTKSFGHF